MTRTFRRVWYRPVPMQEMKLSEAFKRHSGKLLVEADGLRFEHKKVPLVIRDIEAVDYGVHGATTNPSVRVRYNEDGEKRDAYFEDARYFGYAGFFGGTQRLAEAIEHPGETVLETERPAEMRKLWIGLAVSVVLLVLLQVVRANLLPLNEPGGSFTD